MRTVRDVPHPNSYLDCIQLFNTRRHARSYTPYYLPITDAMVLVRTDPGSIAVVNEGIPFITFRNDDTALINSCGLLQDFPPQGTLAPIMDTLFNRLSYCLYSTNWIIHTPIQNHGFRLGTFQNPVMTPIYHDFKDFSIIKLGTTRIWQPSPSSHVVTRFQNPTTPAATPATTPLIPRSPLITQDTHFSIRGPVQGSQYPHPYWISVSSPNSSFRILHPNGEVNSNSGVLTLYAWDTAEEARTFINSLLSQPPVLTCPIEMPSRRTP